MEPPSKTEQRVAAGRRLAQPPPGDEVVISGVAGYFPDSDSVPHLQENLFNKVDLVSGDGRRWTINHPDIPQRTGKINNLTKFDAEFFGVHYKEAHTMDPMGRILLEKTYEAVIDAGVNPIQLKGKKVGVYLGACLSESEKIWIYDKMQINNFGINGCSRAMMANRLSQWLGVTGPSYTTDTACSSSLSALDHAFRAIRDGLCDSAIVAGSNILLHPYVSLQFGRLGVLSSDGCCKSFDNSANGYARSEAIVVCFIQKAKESRRAYAQIVYSKANCDGYKEYGISYPSGHMQKELMTEVYEECSVPPESVEFVEAHGTGTRVGDFEELKAIDEVFCGGRDKPLLIGSIKSNMGHSEPSSGLCAIVKMCIAYETGYIPPNRYFSTPREDSEAMTSGRVQVVAEKQPWSRGYSAVSSFGFGGANVHLVLKNYARTKVNNGLPSDSLPRLVCASGRTEAAVARVLGELAARPLDAEQVRLWHAVHDHDIPGHPFRGYTLLRSSSPDSASSNAQSIARSTSCCAGARRPLWFVYSGAWPGMAAPLMEMPIFASTIHKCCKALVPLGVSLSQLIAEPAALPPAGAALASCAVAAVQVALTDLLRAVGIEPEHVIGHGVGELVCAYAEGRLSAEQTVLAAYHRGLANAEAPPVNGSMKPVELEDNQSLALFEEAARLMPPAAIAVEVAPHAPLREALARCRGQHAGRVALLQPGQPDGVQTLLTGLGQLYEAGWNPRLAEIYPPVQFPVSAGTPMLGHLVEWEHSEDWFVLKFEGRSKLKSCERTLKVNTADEFYDFVVGHVIDGRNLYPATGYLVLVWETLGMMVGTLYTELSVVFEDVRFQRATNIPKRGNLEFTITIQGSGKFEIVESGTSIVTGRIFARKGVGRSYRALPAPGAGAGSGGHHLQTKDFYKELRLRGYQYSGAFRGVVHSNIEGTRGQLAWNDNWVAFMDCMLQLQIIGYDTRVLAVPTRIDRLSIDTDLHYDELRKLDPKLSQQSFKVFVNRDVRIIRSGGIEIRGVHATTITRRVPHGALVLEKQIFVPYFGKTNMKIEEILRVNVHLICENMQIYKVKTIELVDEEYTKHGYEPVVELVGAVLGDMPMMQAELLVLSAQAVALPPHVAVENKAISSESKTTLFIGASLLSRPDVLEQAISTLKDKCFIMSREKEYPNPKAYDDKYDIVTIHDTGCEHIVLFRKKIDPKPATFIQIESADQTFSWIEPVKNGFQKGQKIVVYAQDDDRANGILGFLNCLAREQGGGVAQGFLILDQTAPPFNPELELYAKQINKDLLHNILKDGQWGAYRYLLLDDLETVQADHAYVSTLTVGDLSSMRWLEGPLKYNSVFNDGNTVLVHVYSTALNFRDVMTATGRLPVDIKIGNRLEQECTQGFEVFGKTNNGSRIMGMVSKGLSNLVRGHKNLLWPVPDEWTCEEAATVPVVYVTVYYALVIVGRMRAGEAVLVHAGSGGVGQAAVSVALRRGCRVFTTVGSARKRALVKRLFPTLEDSHIGNSRDTSFENMTRKETNGKGVDLVLNSLSDEKLLASVRCLGNRGRFLEIGKYDIDNNTPVGMLLAAKEISFHGIMINDILSYDLETKKRLQLLVLSGIESGAVRPLTHCCFQKHELEPAFRYLAAGKHVGKIIIKTREEEPCRTVKPARMQIEAIPRYICSGESVYVVVGGLGGMGLELADWLVLRGARRLLLAARRPLASGYAAARMRAWAAYGARVQVSAHDAASAAGCEAMLREACAMGPVRAVFNLAAVLKDAIFQNQTPELFRTTFESKALVTEHLDKLTRKLCPDLQDFVVFSSVSCGRGNVGQTNYGYSNSVMERICENRQQQGLPALVVQWGVVGDVGIIAANNDEHTQLEIGGVLQQTMSSCLLTLDKFLKQDATIVSSIAVAEKKAGGTRSGNVVEAVAQIMGIKDLKTISHQMSLADMGMDSMMGVEIKQTLEREFELFLTAQDIRTLTFAKLVELSKQSEEQSTSVARAARDAEMDVTFIMGDLGDEELISVPYIQMPTKVSNSKKDHNDLENPIIFMLGGTDGVASSLEPLCRGLRCRACVLQLGVEHPGEDLDAMVSRLFLTVRGLLAPGAPFTLLGYSFGCPLMLALAGRLESAGYENGLVFCVDGSPDFNRKMYSSKTGITEASKLQNLLLCRLIDVVSPKNNINFPALMKELNQLESFEDKIKHAVDMSSAQNTKYSPKLITQVAGVLNDRMKVILNFNAEDIKKIQAPIVLIRTKENLPNGVCSQDYGLGVFTRGAVAVHYVEGNHFTILEKEECANIVNEVIFSKVEKPARIIV